ncbi:hypothetical protein ACFL2Q_15125 [Thermodesulfobacteriota bacterium]
MAEDKTKRISAKSIVEDLKAGLTDSELIEKYGLTSQGLQDLFSQLVQAKLATQAYFDKRAALHAGRKPPAEDVQTCAYCGYSSAEEFQVCPRCEQDKSGWLDTMELTKMLDGSFE